MAPHIQQMQAASFALTRKDVQIFAFKLLKSQASNIDSVLQKDRPRKDGLRRL
jgi:hypothetical protein